MLDSFEYLFLYMKKYCSVILKDRSLVEALLYNFDILLEESLYIGHLAIRISIILNYEIETLNR